MRTLDEVIEDLEIKGAVNAVFRGESEDVLHYLEMYRSDRIQWEEDRKYCLEALERYEQAKQKHIDALKDLVKNDPLTWEELKQMEGKPVWTVESTVTNDDNGIERIGRWNIIREVTQEHIIFYIGLPYHKSWQGIGWQAYRKERE